MDLNPIRRWRRYRTATYCAAFMFPAPRWEISQLMSRQLDSFVQLGLSRGWNVPTTAAVSITMAFAQSMQELDVATLALARRNVLFNAPQDVRAEVEWVHNVMKRPDFYGLDPLAFRFTFINCLLSGLLVQGAIDGATKSLFSTIGQKALAEVALRDLTVEAANLIARIGVEPRTKPRHPYRFW